MKIVLKITSCFLLIIASLNLSAQHVNGTWEGMMPGSGGTFLQVNIEQRGFELCGFTYDHVRINKSSYCRAKFEGRFDNKKNLGLLIGTGFIQNSGSHVLMKIKLWRQQGDDKNTLRGTWIQDDILSSFLGSDPGQDIFILKRVASSPKKLPAGVPPCFPKKPRPANTTKTPVVTPKEPVAKKAVVPPASKPPVKTVPKVNKPVVETPVVKAPVVKEPVVTNVPKVAPVLVSPPQTNSTILRQMNARKKSEQSRLVVTSSRINLKLYDNGTVDNDSVSIFYNGRLLLSHQRLSEKAIELNIDLDEGRDIHEITMYAENLGSIPPNTALVVVTAGNKRYELRSKASMEENAVLVFEYKPIKN